jgi:histidinol dehydrogenase
MKKVIYPSKDNWENLCERPVEEADGLERKVKDILDNVRTAGDKALKNYASLFDGFSPESFRVSEEEIKEAALSVTGELKSAIGTAKCNIEKFHAAQLAPEPVIETTEGVKCWRKNVPIEKAGLYIPGGSAPLFSTLLMLAIPARLAGCREIVVCSPAGKDGKINPAILYTAGIMGITEIFRIGGAQAVAAMAYGTETIPKVYKIFGPGNQYVTKAKELVQRDGVAIDMPAGPSEVLVIADKTANPAFVASDLIAQAEHGTDSQVILATDNNDLMEKVSKEVEKQIENLPRRNILVQSLEKGSLVLLKSIDECIDFSNLYAPEHLIINTEHPEALANRVMNAGSVFLGPYSCESLGDYASGTNHTLPTNRYARNYSGLSVESFVRKITFQSVTKQGIMQLGPSVETMAEAEQLEGHRNSVTIRLKNL